MIERDFDVSFVSGLALREKQIQQNYRPVIAVHKWFARRPGTLFRGLLLAEFGRRAPLRELFYEAGDLTGITVADPFMGGGTPLLEANRLGCNVVGYDINPMAYWIVREELEHIDPIAYRKAADGLRRTLTKNIGTHYTTTCLQCGSNADAKYFLWVKVQECPTCHHDVDLFPGYLLAEDRRHPKNVFVCGGCGGLHETADRKHPGNCARCNHPVISHGPAKRNHCACPHCKTVLTYPAPHLGPPRHRMFAIEYYCAACKPRHKGRFFKKPDDADLACYEEASTQWAQHTPRFVPTDVIPDGDESARLHRWGYQHYSDMFNARQLLGLEASCEVIAKVASRRLQYALATNLSDLLRYQNMLCRYDTMALKSLDIFSIHGFPVGLVQVESNLLGIPNGGEIGVGSGGWSNIIDKYAKAKAYCDQPFEVIGTAGTKRKVPIAGEWIGETMPGRATTRKISVHSADAAATAWEPNSLDGVLTDPPYFGNVQYAELMDFCYVWLRRILHEPVPEFAKPSTRHEEELTGNVNMRRGMEHFAQGLANVFTRTTDALKPGAPFVFTYHHNRLDAYAPITVAMLDAGLRCTAAMPCPAEMGASIHINGTESSIVDTVFVCRAVTTVGSPAIDEVSGVLSVDLQALRKGGVLPTLGDARCLAYGHLARCATWLLRPSWESARSATDKVAQVVGFLESAWDRLRLDKAVAATLQQKPVGAFDSAGQPEEEQYPALV